MITRLSLSAVALLAGLGVACAQQTPAPNTAAQNDEKAKPMQNGAEEPGSHPAASADPNAFVNGKLNVPGAPEDGQTVPSKFSARNAALDKVPTMAAPVALTDEQKHRITEGAAKANVPVAIFDAKPADVLPATTQTAELPADVKSSVPMASDLQYIRLKDKVLLVRAPNMTVIGEVAN